MICQYMPKVMRKRNLLYLEHCAKEYLPVKLSTCFNRYLKFSFDIVKKKKTLCFHKKLLFAKDEIRFAYNCIWKQTDIIRY